MNRLMLTMARWIMVRTLRPEVRCNLPRIYRRLDAELLLLLTNNAPPALVQGAIAGVISSATGRRAGADQVEALVMLYSPVLAARNNILYPR
jgi:hypothetical protein